MTLGSLTVVIPPISGRVQCRKNYIPRSRPFFIRLSCRHREHEGTTMIPRQLSLSNVNLAADSDWTRAGSYPR
ncbi:hypothetical protein LX32DRAFT_40858 [Colletotrichum zoysiae]|uniref:Uncharacterized protein n=1 Tax=Colletotrichum zoysiae TaxID=1216348 RepID=A0AAD9HSH5_9PEZI|nr:hypothetical protein LX32DRAFT_40858 [Colletotrichum zoysiae]